MLLPSLPLLLQPASAAAAPSALWPPLLLPLPDWLSQLLCLRASSRLLPKPQSLLPGLLLLLQAPSVLLLLL
jgi:hypothetical protein